MQTLCLEQTSSVERLPFILNPIQVNNLKDILSMQKYETATFESDVFLIYEKQGGRIILGLGTTLGPKGMDVHEAENQIPSLLGDTSNRASNLKRRSIGTFKILEESSESASPISLRISSIRALLGAITVNQILKASLRR